MVRGQIEGLPMNRVELGNFEGILFLRRTNGYNSNLHVDGLLQEVHTIACAPITVS
jgi:hypothetical protein